MKRFAGLLGVMVLLVGTGIGCSPNVRTPRLYNPGPAGYQRNNAANYDPYPLPDAGPEMVGARPRSFRTPRPEVERARQFRTQQSQPQFVAPAPGPVYYGQ